MRTVDLNCDMGEIRGLADDGTQDLLLQSVSSVNISCGAHAGNELLILETIEAAARASVSVGAHPGYPDPSNFGRMRLRMKANDLLASIHEQLVLLEKLCNRCGVAVRHVKPHGALYNEAATDPDVAGAVAEAVAKWRAGALIFGFSGSPTLSVYRQFGLNAWREAFADRRYEKDGSLRVRSRAGALIEQPLEAAEQALALAAEGLAETICVHSDTPGSVAIARAVRLRLNEAGIAVRAPQSD